MGKHDRENTSNGAWPKDKPLPKEDPKDKERKDDGGKHDAGEPDDDDNEET